MIYRLLILLFSTLALWGCDGSIGGKNQDADTPSGTISIAHLKSLCKGEHYRITRDYSLRGVVVANDWLGEFVKSVVVVDRSGGIEIAIESPNLSHSLPIYSEVEILCNGLMLARVGGKIELGAPSTGEFPIENIGNEMLCRYIRVVGTCEDFTPVTKLLTEITPADIGAIVRFDNLRLSDEGEELTWCEVVDNEPKTTFRTFVDGEGNSLAIRTLPTCYYATNKIPTKSISVAGVIDYSNNRYFLRIANMWIIE